MSTATASGSSTTSSGSSGATMDRTLAVQLQIKQNATEIAEALRDLDKWEKDVSKKRPVKQVRVVDTPVRGNSTSVPPLRAPRNVGTVPLTSTATPSATPSSISEDGEFKTPAELSNALGAASAVPSAVSIPKALGEFVPSDPEATERERGNTEFKNGNFAAAVKAYTRCLGLKANNMVAFSNRAMAYLKMKEYTRAVSDCDCALRIDPSHVKSLLRRATAYSALGRHRAAVADLRTALTIEPSSRQAKADLAQATEQLRSATTHAPLVVAPNTANLLAGLGIMTDIPDTSLSQQILPGPDLAVPGLTVPLQDNSKNILEEENDDEDDLDGGEEITIRIVPDDEVPVTSTIVHEEKLEEEVKQTQEISSSPKENFFRMTVIDDDEDDNEEAEIAAILAEKAAKKAIITSSSENKSTKKKISTSTSTKKKITSLPTEFRGAYELERALLNAKSSDDINTHAEVLSRLTITQVKKICRQVREPSVVSLLLLSIGLVYGDRDQQWSKVCKWYDSISEAVSGFEMLFTLMDTPAQQSIQTYLKIASSQLGMKLDSEMKSRLSHAYDCPIL